MPRSVASVKPAQGMWAKPTELAGRPFMVTGASIEKAPNGWESDEVIKLSYILLDYSGPDDLPEHGTVTLGVGGREWLADTFDSNDEPLGPCTFVEIPLKGGHTFWSLEDFVESPASAEKNTKRGRRDIADVPF